MRDRSFATHASIRHHCHFRDKDHVLDTLRKTPSRQARQTDIRPQTAATRPAQHSLLLYLPFTIATRFLHVSALLANRYICTYLFTVLTYLIAAY